MVMRWTTAMRIIRRSSRWEGRQEVMVLIREGDVKDQIYQRYDRVYLVVQEDSKLFECWQGCRNNQLLCDCVNLEYMSNNILLLSSHLYKPNSNIPHAGTLSPGNLLAVTRVEKRAEAGGAFRKVKKRRRIVSGSVCCSILQVICYKILCG